MLSKIILFLDDFVVHWRFVSSNNLFGSLLVRTASGTTVFEELHVKSSDIPEQTHTI